MATELPFLIAVAVSIGASCLVVALFHSPMSGLLEDGMGSTQPAQFWSRFIAVLVVLSPIVALMLSHGSASRGEDTAYQVLEFLRWSMLGLLATLIILAVHLTPRNVDGRRSVSADAGSVDELGRLLRRVDAVREREAARSADD